MRIIILGAGQVGSTIAEYLASEENDVTVVDVDARRLADLQNRLDIQTIEGSGAYPDILERAGAQEADLLIAVTSSDETNIVACQVAYTLFRTPTKIARIRSRHYHAYGELFDNDVMPIDYWISPEQIVTDNVAQMIIYPGTLYVADFSDPKFKLILTRVEAEGPLVRETLAMFKMQYASKACRMVALFRQNRLLPITDDLIFMTGDEVFFIAEAQHIVAILRDLGQADSLNKRMMIAGGGNIGVSLAKVLETDHAIKLIERSAERTQYLADELHRSTVLLGDVSDSVLLQQENINNIDVFCAVTNDDETNVMACLQAKRLGAKACLALVSKAHYVELLQYVADIDMVVSPQLFTISRILRYIRRGDIASVHEVGYGIKEVIEVIAHGDRQTSKVVGRKVSELSLPKGANIAGILRDGQFLLPEDDPVMAPQDHVILLLTEKKTLRQLERLFQVSPTFF